MIHIMQNKFICMECGRVSAKKETVCHPKKL